MMKHFDDIIKEKLDQHEYDFSEQSWNQLESKLAKPSNNGESSFNTYLTGAIAATSLMVLVISNAPNANQPESLIEESSKKEIALDNAKSEPTDLIIVESVHFDVQQEHDIVLQPAANTGTTSVNKVGNVEAERNTESPAKTPKSSETNKVMDETNGELPNQTLSIDFTATGIQCEGKKIKFQTTQNAPKGTVQWIIDDVYVLDGNSAEYKFETSGRHTAKLIYKDSKNDNPVIVEKELMIFENPEFNIDIESPEYSDCFNKEAIFRATPSNISYTWTINGNSYGKAGKITQKLPEGWYNIVVQGVNEHGCSTKQSTSYNHGSGINIFMGSAFSPTNNDDDNDLYLPVNLDKMASFEFRVLNMYNGDVVYTTNELKPWDGSIKNTSEKARSGEIYFIELIATDECGMIKKFSQKITVL